MDVIAEMRKAIELVNSAKPCPDYLVLDPSMEPNAEIVEGKDASGYDYVMCSAAVLDSMIVVHPNVVKQFSLLMGIPVYRRQDLPEGWPGTKGD